METYKFLIILFVISSILIFYGSRLVTLLDIHLKHIQTKPNIEKFSEKPLEKKYPDAQLNADTTLPDSEPKGKINQYPDTDIHNADAYPGDDYKYLETDKIYINPFYPEETKTEMKPTQNFPSPDEMSSVERNAFKYGYPNAMTMQDYVNWLYLFRNSPDLLNLDHNINYQKLIKNIKIKFEEGRTPPPSKKMPPLTEDAYFNTMYTQNPTQLDPLFTQVKQAEVRVANNLGDPSNGLMAFNYDEYPNFSQLFDVFGNSQNVYNGNLAEKTDPYFLQKFVGPVWKLQKSGYFK